MAKKSFQKSIRILGKAHRSPKFDHKWELDKWLEGKKADKNLYEEGLVKPADEWLLLKDYFYNQWLPRRKQKHTKATWGSDEQRFKKYVEGTLGRVRVSKISTPAVKQCLDDVVVKHKVSPKTRTKVKALLSKIFNDARNEKSPLRTTNPVHGINFDDGARVGDLDPLFIKRTKDILHYLETAKELGPIHLMLAALGIMAGLRKQEMIPLTYQDLDDESKMLLISKKYVQAENKVMDGTKKGQKVTRYVPIPDELITLIRDHRANSEFQAEDDFIMPRPNGGVYHPRDFSYFTEDTEKASGIKVTTHGLRHTYGRLFVKGSGNVKALQAILGHSNSATTEIYSKLGGDSVAGLRNTVSFNVRGKKGKRDA